MGWCSGTVIFDRMCTAILDKHWKFRDESVEEVLTELAKTLEDEDWDCQQDSGYWDHPVVHRIMAALHPDWDWSDYAPPHMRDWNVEQTNEFMVKYNWDAEDPKKIAAALRAFSEDYDRADFTFGHIIIADYNMSSIEFCLERYDAGQRLEVPDDWLYSGSEEEATDLATLSFLHMLLLADEEVLDATQDILWGEDGSY